MSDPINRPAHYTFSLVEVIDALEAWDLPWHLCNVIKYLARAGRKDPAKLLEDLEKARWYLNRYIALVHRKQAGRVVEIIPRDPGPLRSAVTPDGRTVTAQASKLVRDETAAKLRSDLDALTALAAREFGGDQVPVERRNARPAKESQADREARLVASGHLPDCSGGICCENLCVEPPATSDRYWQRHPLGSPERVQAVEEHRAAKAVAK